MKSAIRFYVVIQGITDLRQLLFIGRFASGGQLCAVTVRRDMVAIASACHFNILY
ncbi:MAG: hypothetical protein GY931_16065 [Maribacter sp.]|nr:hypothetical protein [Maribacter sp.]